MENRIINLAVVAEIAKALKELNEQMVFVGGAVVSLYTNDVAADEIRPTGDIDMTVILSNRVKWPQIEERLRALQFFPDPFGHAMCRYLYKDIPVDVMPPEGSNFGPSNRWYKIGFDQLQTINLEGVNINILSAPYYLATKFEAFNSRGKDYRTSHDMEDIIYILDNRIEIAEEIEKSPKKVRMFLQSELQKLVTQSVLEDVLMAHIHPLVIETRLPLVMEKINRILSKYTHYK